MSVVLPFVRLVVPTQIPLPSPPLPFPSTCSAYISFILYFIFHFYIILALSIFSKAWFALLGALCTICSAMENIHVSTTSTCHNFGQCLKEEGLLFVFCKSTSSDFGYLKVELPEKIHSCSLKFFYMGN